MADLVETYFNKKKYHRGCQKPATIQANGGIVQSKWWGGWQFYTIRMLVRMALVWLPCSEDTRTFPIQLGNSEDVCGSVVNDWMLSTV